MFSPHRSPQPASPAQETKREKLSQEWLEGETKKHENVQPEVFGIKLQTVWLIDKR